MDFIQSPWPWYVGGPLIALTLLLLLFFGRSFGMSSNLRTICTACGADKFADFFKFDWKANIWNLVVIFGAAIGGYIAMHVLTPDQSLDISAKTIERLEGLGFKNAGDTYLPPELFSLEGLGQLKNWLILLISGLLIGFGARYAGGCTSGHAITGLSNLQLPSLIAVIGFFIGGLTMVHLLFPIIF